MTGGGQRPITPAVWPGANRIGLGCMALTGLYGRVDVSTATATVHAALDAGIDHFDTAELYGPFRNEELLAAALGPDADRVSIATKVGYRLKDGQIAGLDSRPASIRAAVEGSLKRLGRERIDLLYQHRPDPDVPVEEVVGAMSDLIGEGKARWLGLSATDADTLRRGHAIHPIAAVQNEYSLLERGSGDGLLEAVEQIGAVFVAFSPLGRGRLIGPMVAPGARAADDYRRNDKRFTVDAVQAAQPIIDVVRAIGQERHIDPAAVALAWLMAQHPAIRALPGARTPPQVRAVLAAQTVRLTVSDLERLSAS